MIKMKYTFTFSIFLLFTILCSQVSAQGKISIEGSSRDITLTVRGPEKAIDLVNPTNPNVTDNCIMLLSSPHGAKTGISKTNKVVIVVNADMVVDKVINGVIPGKAIPDFIESANIAIPQGGFVLVASDDNYKSKGYKKFLAENFRSGDVVKLRIDGQVKTLEEVIASSGSQSVTSLIVNNDALYTTPKGQELITGYIQNPKKGKTYTLAIVKAGKTVSKSNVATKGKFSQKIQLSPKVNYFDIVLYENGKEIAKKALTIYQKTENKNKPEIVMWIEQFPNAKTLTSEAAVEDMVLKCVETGVTALGIDVKGPEGYVSYKKNDLSRTPYFTSTINPNKQVAPSDMDLLATVLEKAHKHGLKVYASFNFFTEGNVTTSDYAILKDHPEWEEIVQRPEDKGRLLKISESTAGKEARAGKRIVLAFVNPANKDVQDFQLLRVEEVLKNYDIDGIVMDRCRYDNLYADFSKTTEKQFGEYLRNEGKTLTDFPAQAFTIDVEGKMVEGKYFVEWITFRSSVVKQFSDRLRTLVDKYKKEKNPNLKLSAYVGSWFESYWQNGVNWSSPNWKYNSSLNFPESRLYTSVYAKTSYLPNLDFLMIGTYYKTKEEIEKYITLGNILTNGELPLYGSLSLPDLKSEQQAEAFKASLNHSAGLMLFDLCYVDWTTFIENMKKAKK